MTAHDRWWLGVLLIGVAFFDAILFWMVQAIEGSSTLFTSSLFVVIPLAIIGILLLISSRK